MNKRIVTLTTVLVISLLMLSACSTLSGSMPQTTQIKLLSDSSAGNQAQAVPTATLSPTQVVTPAQNVGQSGSGLLAAYEGTLENIYTQVSPSVVNINVITQQAASSQQIPQNPFFGFPFSPNTPNSQGSNSNVSEALGSGFVWDKQGDIITNNHVIDGASNIQVTFSNGETVPAKVIGTDSQSDLAVIQVNIPADQLQPIQLGDSGQLKVGQLAIAIGNPFGLEGTMTVGIISALGRSLPVDMNNQNGPSYTIPDIIQTDAPINPGNSGGVLLNDQGQVVGVTSAIDSPVSANAGIGFAIPSAILRQVIPSLITTGHFDHSYIGISGVTLTPDLATAMSLKPDQQGALVIDVVPGGPADKAGLLGSQKQVTILGQSAVVGGDVITAVDGQTVQSMDDLIAYLNDHTTVGQKVTLTILRNSSQMTVDVTLSARPLNQTQTVPSQTTNNNAWLGIVGMTLNSSIAQAMNLDPNQPGILIEQVESGSPADQAGLLGSYKSTTINGQQVRIGGDVIVAIDGQPVSQLSDLQDFLSQSQPGDEASILVLRDGAQLEVMVTLGAQPSLTP